MAARVMTPAATTVQNQGVGRCLGCRMSRMSSPARRTDGATGAADVKLVCGGDAFATGTVPPAGAAGVSAEAFATVNSRPSASTLWQMEVLRGKIFMIVAFSVAGF